MGGGREGREMKRRDSMQWMDGGRKSKREGRVGEFKVGRRDGD